MHRTRIRAIRQRARRLDLLAVASLSLLIVPATEAAALPSSGPNSRVGDTNSKVDTFEVDRFVEADAPDLSPAGRLALSLDSSGPSRPAGSLVDVDMPNPKVISRPASNNAPNLTIIPNSYYLTSSGRQAFTRIGNRNWGESHFWAKHGLDSQFVKSFIPTVPSRDINPSKRRADRYEYNGVAVHVVCTVDRTSGTIKCDPPVRSNVFVAVDFNNQSDGKIMGTVTAYCPPVEGMCPYWVNRSRGVGHVKQ